MKVSIIAGGRFHAFHLAHQLQLRNSLQQLYTFSYTKHDQSYVSPSYINQFFLPALLDKTFQKGQLYRFITPSTYNVYKDNLFDRLVSKQLDPYEADLFVCWAHYAATSIKKIRKNNRANIIIESGSCHILEQQKIISNEYHRHGLTYPAIHPRNVEKMLQEYHEADYIMTLSKFSRDSFINQGFNPDKLLKVTPGTNIEFFMKKTIKPTQNSASSTFRVIFVGLAGLRKGIPYLIDAWNHLDLPETTTELLIVGNIQRDLKHVLKSKKLKNNIILYGSTDRTTLRSLYHNANAFVLPSLEEGCAMVTGEAMASGLPVICSTHTGAEELITDGKEGFLIPPYSAEAIQEKIQWCYDNQEQAAAMGRQGQQTIQRFTWDHYGEQVYNAYQAIAKNTKE